MTASRSRRQTKAYDKFLKQPSSNDCEFCAIKKGQHQYVAETKSFLVIKNIFPYSLWDSQKVADHLMIIPKKHIDSLAKLSDAEAGEYLKLLTSYEEQGYNVYARAPGSVMKTVAHQHTHLIKPAGGPRKFLFFIRRPYIRFVR